VLTTFSALLLACARVLGWDLVQGPLQVVLGVLILVYIVLLMVGPLVVLAVVYGSDVGAVRRLPQVVIFTLGVFATLHVVAVCVIHGRFDLDLVVRELLILPVAAAVLWTPQILLILVVQVFVKRQSRKAEARTLFYPDECSLPTEFDDELPRDGGEEQQ